MLSGCITFIALKLLDAAGKLKNTVVVFEWEEVIACGVTAVIALSVSVIIPLVMIGKTEPRDILKAEVLLWYSLKIIVKIYDPNKSNK